MIKQTHCYFKKVGEDWLLLYANCEPREVSGSDAGGVWVENRVAALGFAAQRDEDIQADARRAVAVATGVSFQRGYVRGQRDCAESYEPILENYRHRVISKDEEIRDLREAVRSVQDARTLDQEF